VNLLALATAESAITIMAASMPILRVLIKDTQSTEAISLYYGKQLEIVILIGLQPTDLMTDLKLLVPFHLKIQSTWEKLGDRTDGPKNLVGHGSSMLHRNFGHIWNCF